MYGCMQLQLAIGATASMPNTYHPLLDPDPRSYLVWGTYHVPAGCDVSDDSMATKLAAILF